MKICFYNADALMEGIQLLAEDLKITLVDAASAELLVTVEKTDRRCLRVIASGDTATIAYGDGKARFFRALSILLYRVRKGERAFSVEETPLFVTNGAMVDMSRNGVMNSATVKAMLRSMARMGLNSYMLYTEDVYTLEEYPYFGHLRGRYTVEELRELDDYADTLGIELIPCIQTLGHLSTYLSWGAAGSHRDTASELLVGAEETYRLIDEMLRTLTTCFRSRRVHIGMDETKTLGTGAYLARNGYREREEIYFEHLERVASMARSHGLSPMMWSDMFFRMAGKSLEHFRDYDTRVEFSEDVIASIPKGVGQVFWDYYSADEEFYVTNIQKHRTVFGEDPLFAGGIWTWSGHCPLYSRSEANTLAALRACRREGLREVLATVWHNGAEASTILSLAGLAWYADFDYRGEYDADGVRDCFRFACDASYDELMLLELPEHPNGVRYPVTRALLYNDPLLGKADRHFEGLDCKNHYRAVSERLALTQGVGELFLPAYDVICKLSAVLECKGDFGIRLKAAYDAGEREALAALMAECDEICDRIAALRESHRRAWMLYYKPFGWETHDLRYGGLLARFDTVRDCLSAYLAGEIERIAELEEPRLRLDGRPEEDGAPLIDGNFLWNGYRTYATVGVF